MWTVFRALGPAKVMSQGFVFLTEKKKKIFPVLKFSQQIQILEKNVEDVVQSVVVCSKCKQCKYGLTHVQMCSN